MRRGRKGAGGGAGDRSLDADGDQIGRRPPRPLRRPSAAAAKPGCVTDHTATLQPATIPRDVDERGSAASMFPNRWVAFVHSFYRRRHHPLVRPGAIRLVRGNIEHDLFGAIYQLSWKCEAPLHHFLVSHFSHYSNVLMEIHLQLLNEPILCHLSFYC